MWMMGYTDGGEFNVPDSFNGRKLRPLIPRNPPVTCPNNTSNSSPPRLGLLHGNEFFSLNQHLATMADQSKRDFHTQPVVVSSRWNPTPEQLRTLEDLYRRGTRTPSAEQIQHITTQLRRYGKIEGKNVFYWFQNHKARERQKRRRQMESAAPDHRHEHQQNLDLEIFGRKESGENRTAYEGEQTKNWAPSTNCSTLPEEVMSMQRAAKGVVAECRGDGWIQFDEVELQERRSFMERNATWQMMQLSCPSPTHLINTSSSSTNTNNTTATTTTTTSRILAEAEAEGTASRLPTVVAGRTIRTMDSNKHLIKTHNDLNIFIAPYRENNVAHGLINHFISNEEDHNNGCGDSHQTLQLFPLRSSGGGGESINDKGTETASASVAAAMNVNFTTPHQFFEFLPLKN